MYNSVKVSCYEALQKNQQACSSHVSELDLPFFGVEIMGLFHCDNCCVVSHLHPQTDVLLRVITSKKFLGPLKPFLEVLAYSDMTLLLFHAQ
jgi:hypothetical protein